MKEYELFYLIGETRKGDFRTIDQEVRAIVATHGGTWKDKQVTEERRLAYPIKHERRGLYVAERFTLPDADDRDGTDLPDNPVAAMSRELGLHAGVLRFIIVDAADLPPLATKDERESAMIAARQAREIRQSAGSSSEDMDKQLAKALNI